MSSRKEHTELVAEQKRILNEAWEELFRSGSPEQADARFEEDHSHPPVALGTMLHALYEEVLEDLSNSISHALATGQMQQEDILNRITTILVGIGRTTAVRMYLMGQHLHAVLPFDTLAQCPCSTLFDDEIDNLLKTAAIDPDSEKGGEQE